MAQVQRRRGRIQVKLDARERAVLISTVDRLQPHTRENAQAAYDETEFQTEYARWVSPELERERVRRGGCFGDRTHVTLCPAGLRLTEPRLTRGILSLADPPEEAVGRHLGDSFAAIRALLQVLVDRLGQPVVELAQAIRTQGLVGGVKRRYGVHGAISRSGSND